MQWLFHVLQYNYWTVLSATGSDLLHKKWCCKMLVETLRWSFTTQVTCLLYTTQASRLKIHLVPCACCIPLKLQDWNTFGASGSQAYYIFLYSLYFSLFFFRIQSSQECSHSDRHAFSITITECSHLLLNSDITILTL